MTGGERLGMVVVAEEERGRNRQEHQRDQNFRWRRCLYRRRDPQSRSKKKNQGGCIVARCCCGWKKLVAVRMAAAAAELAAAMVSGY